MLDWLKRLSAIVSERYTLYRRVGLRKLPGKVAGIYDFYYAEEIIVETGYLRNITKMSDNEKLVKFHDEDLRVKVVGVMDDGSREHFDMSFEEFLRKYDKEFMRRYAVFLPPEPDIGQR